VAGVSSHTVRVEDESLESVLEGSENKSEVMREALRLYARERDLIETDDLTEPQREAYNWLLERTGGGDGYLLVDGAENSLAQYLGKSSKSPKGNDSLIRQEITKPLRSKGYIKLMQGMDAVRIYVVPPDRLD
jgi:Arc/MetJ-type ribon-helix-helix transcriptional regulator